MKIKLEVRSPRGVPWPVTVTAEGTATTAELASALWAGMTGVPADPARPATLQIVTEHGAEVTTVPAKSMLTETRLCSGQRVRVVPDEPSLSRGYASAVGWLRAISGPAVGQAFPLRSGAQFIGRDQTCDIVLDDSQVSKRHARLTVRRRVVEVADLNSSNGVIVGDAAVDRATLGPKDVLVIGATSLMVERADTGTARDEAADGFAFNRSPVVRVPYAGREFQAPQPPAPATPNKFPLVAMVAPLLMGVVMYAMTRNALSLVFVALSPLIAFGTWLDHRLTQKRKAAAEAGQFTEALAQLADDLDQALTEEQSARCAETPSLAALLEAAHRSTPDLWSRRPEDDDFLRLNLGYGAAESRHTVELPSRGQATTDDWNSLLELQAEHAQVEAVPIMASLRDSGDLGLAGPRDWLDPLARGLVAQIAVLHSPAELVLCAIASADSSPRWNWLMWLPHTGSIHSPIPGPHLANSPGAVPALVAAIEELIVARAAVSRRGDVPQPAVVVLVENDAPIERGRLVAVAKSGPEVGVHVVWLADRQDKLPTACRAFVALDRASGQPAAGFVDDDRLITLTGTESLAPEAADNLARRLAPVTDAGAPAVDQSDLPRSVAYLALAGPELAESPDVVVDRWREDGSLPSGPGKRANTTLRALIGQGAQGEFVLDLRTQGPHALVGGTTGAGKSEFLQSWILGLASAHSPLRVTFLFVDYKGGAAFSDCVQLPHTVGLVTDLSPHLVRRALTSLRAELRHREHLLNQKKAKDLISLERTGDPECPPSLIIVVDEFAALVKEVPEFVDGVVDVAQRGRSLGLHLILATQRPAGVIKDNLRANTNLRVALRMSDEADSSDVIGTKLAAEFDPRVPGRGAVRTGPGRIALFQAGYAGGRTSTTPEASRVDVETLTFGPGRPWEIPQAPRAVAADSEEGPTDIARITAVIRRAAADQAIPAPRKPWLPDLAACYDLADLTRRLLARPAAAGGQQLVLGMVDDPASQAQHLHAYAPERDGALAVFGTSGSGKSAVLRTLAVGAALQAGVSRTDVYGLDFGAAGLSMLAQLPVVGGVIDGADHELVARLLTRLAGTLDERTPRYAAVRAASISEYRATTGDTSEPRILLLVDGFGAFRDAYESQPGRSQYLGVLARLLAEGRSVGVHVVLTADRPAAIPSAIAAGIQRRLVLQQADDSAYLSLGVAKDILDAGSPPGRGVFAGESNEIQIAVPSGSPATADQAAAIDALAARLAERGVPQAEPVQRLTARVVIGDLPAATAGRPTLGLEDTSLGPIGFNPQGAFIVAGMPGSGRTTALRGLAQSLRRWRPDLPMYYFGPKRSAVGREAAWTDTATNPEDMRALAGEITPALQQSAEDTPGVVVMIEGLSELIGSPADQALADLVKLARRNGHFAIGETETAGWGSSWPLVAEIRNSRRGVVLQPDSADGDNLFRVSFPRVKRADFPPGRGMYVDAGRSWTVQLPLPGGP